MVNIKGCDGASKTKSFNTVIKSVHKKPSAYAEVRPFASAMPSVLVDGLLSLLQAIIADVTIIAIIPTPGELFFSF